MQTIPIQNLKVIRYRRKSTEDDEKQIASLADQEAAHNTTNRQLNIASEQMYDNVEEARSAKLAGNRPEFTQRVLKALSQGKANALQVWHPDRISRNIEETSAVISLMDSGQLLAVITPHNIYWNNPTDKFMLSFLCLQAKMNNENLANNVKRGAWSKVRKGWRPGVAPIGYRNDPSKPQGERDIVVDPKRFSRVRKLWDYALTGKYSLHQLQEIANTRLMLRTVKRRKQGDKPLSLSHIHRILTNPFYYGFFWWTDPETGVRELREGSHRKLISEDEFRRVQAIFGRPTRLRSKSHVFAYSGLIRCGTCENSSVTAEEKWQVICGNCKKKFALSDRERCPVCDQDLRDMTGKKILHYVYYHCTRKANPACTEKCIRLEDLEAQIDAILARFTIKPKLLRWALDALQANRVMEQKYNADVQRRRQREQLKLKDEIAELNRFIVRQENQGWTLMRKTDALAERDKLQAELQKIADANNDDADSDWTKSTLDAFDYAARARYWLRKGTLEQKRAVLEGLGSNMRLSDKKLSVSLPNPLIGIEKLFESTTDPGDEFEPTKSRGKATSNGRSRANHSTLCARWDDVRTYFVDPKRVFHAPLFTRLKSEMGLEPIYRRRTRQAGRHRRVA